MWRLVFYLPPERGEHNDAKHEGETAVCEDAFFERTDIIGLLFRINKHCMAKVRYLYDDFVALCRELESYEVSPDKDVRSGMSGANRQE